MKRTKLKLACSTTHFKLSSRWISAWLYRYYLHNAVNTVNLTEEFLTLLTPVARLRVTQDCTKLLIFNSKTTILGVDGAY